MTLLNSSVLIIHEFDNIAAAASLMRETRVGSLVVVNELEKVTGIITGRDIVLDVVAIGGDPETVQVRDIMSDHPVCLRATESNDVLSVAEAMGRAKVRRMPVVDDDMHAVGFVSLDDVLVKLSAALGSATKVVTSYVAAGRLESVRRNND